MFVGLKMRSILQVTQLLALAGICSGTTAQTSFRGTETNKNSDVIKVIGNAKVPLSEADVLKMRHRPEMKTPTAEQQIAIEKHQLKMSQAEALRSKSAKPKRHPTSIVQNGDSEFQPLTHSQKESLKLGRDAAIEDSMVHQVRPDESKCMASSICKDNHS